MINRQALLTDLQKLLQRLEADLLERSESAEVPEVGSTLRAEYERAKTAERTAQNYEDWRTDWITQAAAAWVLSCVFVRFLEDNRLIDPPKIAGPAGEGGENRLQRARDEHEHYFGSHPRETDREYLLSVFDQLGKLPGTKDVFGEHNPIRELPNWLSGDAAGELLQFFQKIDANTGALVHDFTDPNWDTRFLGDLYQDLSEAARKKYALLQTPEFVEEFILDRTLNPALEEFGLDAPPVLDRDGKPVTEAGFRMIDPACGSGHFLLGAFPRILDRWQRKEPGTNVRELVQRALDSINGVDVNPYAVAIARFRLLLAAMRASSVTRLIDAPAFRVNVACGDSLLHGVGEQQSFGWTDLDHAFRAEDLAELRRILRPGAYHAVVANPPYITPKDRALNQAYRDRYSTCHMKYSLAVPFMQRLFQLANRGDNNGQSAGYTGQITANSFMKREFGKKLIESFFPTVDLTHVIDTSGAYIPAHGTPTVILCGKNQRPLGSTLRTVMGIRGEPATPDDPARGLVWSAIVEQIDQPGSQSGYVSAGDSPREAFHTHPWSIGGGGAAELKEQLDAAATGMLKVSVDSIGPPSFAGVDDMFFSTEPALKRAGVAKPLIRQLINGDVVRDWCITRDIDCLVPYDDDHKLLPFDSTSCWGKYVWLTKAASEGMISFNKQTRRNLGEPWWSWYRWIPERFRTPLSIVFAFVATHNHFVLDRGGKVFKQSAPVIKLPPGATEVDHFALLGLLNSSAGCFWMKQIFHDKGSTVDAQGARQTTVAFENFREFTGTGLLRFPLPGEFPVDTTRRLDALAETLRVNSPAAILSTYRVDRSPHWLSQALTEAHAGWNETRGLMIFLQEELDWECYRLYGLTNEDLTYQGEPFPLELGERSFEILMARSIARQAMPPTTWFERHGSTPLTGPSAHWPEAYLRLYHWRHDVQQENADIGLIEQPEYKRRWNTEPWESQLERALREWLLDRLESYFDFDGRMQESGQGSVATVAGASDQEEESNGQPKHLPPPLAEIALVSVARLADVARQDAQFLKVGDLYRDDAAFDVQALVAELVAAGSVPLLPVLRYKPSGLRKRAEWEQTWELQRREDAGEQVGTIPVPPKYTSADFISTGGARYWALRGKLDVPKERWISFPHCEGPDGTPVIAWAGYDHLQLAKAISAYYVRVQTEFGGTDDARLIPLLACLIELLPWLKQWHNEPDPAFDSLRMGDYFEGFVNEEARQLGKTLTEIKAWTPPARANTRGRRRTT